MDKRVVFQPTQGGVAQIVGALDEGAKPPVGLGPFETQGRIVEFASLIKVTPRYVLYREVMHERPKNHLGHVTGGGFDQAQR